MPMIMKMFAISLLSVYIAVHSLASSPLAVGFVPSFTTSLCPSLLLSPLSFIHLDLVPHSSFQIVDLLVVFSRSAPVYVVLIFEAQISIKFCTWRYSSKEPAHHTNSTKPKDNLQ
jgi:hypothetical protein